MRIIKRVDAEKRFCPFTMNGESYGKCATILCMAWEPQRDDETIRGYCLLIPDKVQT